MQCPCHISCWKWILTRHKFVCNNAASVVDVMSKLQLQKSSVLRHMTSVLQPILEKGILDHSIIHRALMEFLSIADQVPQMPSIQKVNSIMRSRSCLLLKILSISVFFLNRICWKSSAADVIQQLSSADLVRMMHTKDGSRIAMLCIKHGSAKVFLSGHFLFKWLDLVFSILYFHSWVLMLLLVHSSINLFILYFWVLG